MKISCIDKYIRIISCFLPLWTFIDSLSFQFSLSHGDNLHTKRNVSKRRKKKSKISISVIGLAAILNNTLVIRCIKRALGEEKGVCNRPNYKSELSDHWLRVINSWLFLLKASKSENKTWVWAIKKTTLTLTQTPHTSQLGINVLRVFNIFESSSSLPHHPAISTSVSNRRHWFLYHSALFLLRRMNKAFRHL